MSKPTDELAAVKDAATKVSKQVDALQGELQKKLECQTIELRVAKLRTEIEMENRDIETLKTLARSRGEEPKIDDRLRSLKGKQWELEDLQLKYEIQCKNTQRRRWWEFWK